MIALDSNNHPFLAIARKYGVDYGSVLLYSDMLLNVPYMREREADTWVYIYAGLLMKDTSDFAMLIAELSDATHRERQRRQGC